MPIDVPSWLWGVAAGLPLYWSLDTFVVPRLGHLFYLVARHRERF